MNVRSGDVCLCLGAKRTVHKDMLNQQKGQTVCSREGGLYRNVLSVSLWVSSQCFWALLAIEAITFSRTGEIRFFFFSPE